MTSAECQRRGLPLPTFNLVSDRRGRLPVFNSRFIEHLANCLLGGRTAWSATVTVQGFNLAARYWYDGQYIENAKDDAAEVMITKLRNPAITNAAPGFQNQSGSGRHSR